MNREQKKRETRRRILEAAMQLFSEQGFDQTTVEQITKRAGVAKGTFFNYFQSKEQIMCDLQGIWAIGEIGKLREKPGPYVPRAKALLVELVNRMDVNRTLARAILLGNLSGTGALEAQSEFLRQTYEAVVPVIRLGQERGEFVTKYPAELIAQMAVQTFFGALYYWAMEQGDDNLSEHMALTMEIFFDGVTP